MPTNPLTLTSELDAVNLMLRAIGESRVQTLEDATHEDAADALELLRHWNMTVQEEGWRFNTRAGVLLTRNQSNEIVLPFNTLAVETSGESSDIAVSFIEGKLFDISNNTFTWNQDLYVTYKLHYAFTKIPQAARNYIVQCAGLEFVGNETPGTSRPQFSRERLIQARSALRRTEALIRKPNILNGSLHALKMQIGRRPFTP